MRHKYSPAVLQTLGGPPQKDFEYEKKLQDYKEAKSRMVTLKKVIDNFPRKLEGYKQMLDTIAGTCDFVFDKNQKGYCQFMHNITSAHKALTNKLIGLFNQFGQLRNTTNGWIKQINDVSAKCRLREQCKKNYEHYEQKLYELNVDRMKEVKKKKKISESDHERFVRNIGKFQKAGKELIYTSNQAFRAIEQFLNMRYDQIVMAMVGLVEAERTFYNEASHIINFFSNARNNAIDLKKKLITLNTKYDASTFIKGRVLLNMSLEEFFSSNYRVAPPPPGFGPSNNNPNQGQGQGPNQGFGMGQSFNPNSQQNNGIINPFSADNNDLGNNNNMNNNNNFGRSNTANNGFVNKSTRDTFALNNPYNTQANPYSGNPNNNMNNNYGSNNNFSNPFGGNNMNDNDLAPIGENDGFDPYGGNNNNNNNNQDPYGGNNDFPYGGNNNNNNQDPYGGNNNNQNNFNGPGDNNMGKENSGNNDNKNNNNNNGDEDPFDF